MTTKVVKGTLWTMMGLAVPMFFSLFATPIVTRILGAEEYGLFLLILLIPAYLSFADFGMNMASTRFGSAAFGEGSRQKEARIVRTAALIALVSSLPFAAAMVIFSRQIVDLFNVPEHLTLEAAYALKLASATYVVNFLTSSFNTPELSRLRMDLNISITSGMRLAGIIATPVVVYFGGGVVGAVVVALGVSILTLAGHIVASARLLPELIGFTIDRASIRPMLKFGGSLVIAGIAAVLLTNLEKFVLARATSVEALAYYSVATTFAAMLTLVSASIVQSLLPAFSQLQSSENRSALNTLYSRGIRLTLVWLVPGVVFMVLVGQPFFDHWFGPNFGRESPGPYYITLAGLFFNVLAYFPYATIMASGRSDFFAKLYWLELLPYILLVWWMANRFGAKGAAAAWSIRVICDAVIIFWLARKVGGVSYIQAGYGYPALAFLVMFAPIAGLAYYRELNWKIVAIAGICGFAYSIIVWKKVLQSEEISWLKASMALALRR